MQRITLLLLLLVTCLATTIQAQTAAPKPSPEMKKLHFLLGRWTYECEYQATPLGPAGRNTGEVDFRMVLGGFFMESHYVEKGTAGDIQIVEFDRYDPATKSFADVYFANDGSVMTGTFTVNGNTVEASEKVAIGGKQYMLRVTTAVSNDGMDLTQKGELSSDGKAWKRWFEMKGTKPAAKK